MPTKYDDARDYQFHEKDIPGMCFVCCKETTELLIFRQIATMLLVHLCRDCIYENIADYLLDNTRPWLSEKNTI